jgi:peroxiredoxin
MQDRTETLEIGSLAPEFSLPSVNREGGRFVLSTLLERGPVIVEFLRGTW